MVRCSAQLYCRIESISITLMCSGNSSLCRNFFNKNNAGLFKQVFLNYVHEHLFDKFGHDNDNLIL